MTSIFFPELVVASHNQGKVREIQALLTGYVGKVYTATDLNLPEPEETGSTFTENALLKARVACLGSGKIALADDSGFAVNALNGEPGIYSARWAGASKDFQHAMQQVWDKFQGTERKENTASFHCVLALAFPDGRQETFHGTVKGTLCWPPRGSRGFGYDPMFIPSGHRKTFGEMEPAEKESISHRTAAFSAMLTYLQK